MLNRSRMRMYAEAGLAPPVPNKPLRRRWEFVDDRVEPDGPADGEFQTHIEWINKARSWIGLTGAKCYDARGRRCRMGSDFARARDENAFPVRFYGLHHYPEPYIPSRGEFVAIEAIASTEESLSISEIRKHLGAGRITWRKLADILGPDALEGDDKRRLTETGRAAASFLFDCRRRAGYVY